MTLTFTKPMNRASMESAFQLSPTVTGTFDWSNLDRTVTFTPTAPLPPATTFAGRLTGTARDTNGVTFDGNFNRASQGSPVDDFLWTFRTPPLNDDFGNAPTLAGVSGSVLGANRNATRESSEPNHAQNSGGASVWFRWTAPGSGSVAFDTAGSAFDTLLAVYAGTNLAVLTEVASNDDAAGVLTSRVAFQAEQGVAYAIAVDGKITDDYFADAPPMGLVVLAWDSAMPVIGGFQPGRGPTNGIVVIHGEHFAGATDVRFNSAAAFFTINSDHQLTATVPAAATSGPVQVSTDEGAATSNSDFLVVDPRTSPELTVNLLDVKKIQLTWPAAATNFTLQFATTLLAPADWVDVPGTPDLVGGNNVMSLGAGAAGRFYRLRNSAP